MVLRSRPSASDTVEIRVNGTRIRQVTWFKYLGFIITPSLSFADHVTRATERARAATAVITAILRRVQICSLHRLGTYLACYGESQFFCAELLPTSTVDAINSIRSFFVRSCFDLPRTTSHELATVLFDAWPAEILLLHRRHRFLRSIRNHDFQFVRDACALDCQSLLNSPQGWHHNLVRLLGRIESVSTVDFDALATLDRMLAAYSPADHSSVNFYYIKNGDSDSLSFYRLFPSLDALNSFRSLSQTVPFAHCRLIILFCSPLLPFRLCNTVHDACPLCKKPWLWDHFLSCAKLSMSRAEGRARLSLFESSVISNDWSCMLRLMRENIAMWCDVLPDVAFPCDVIDTLAI
jgi:hypothetical protein